MPMPPIEDLPESAKKMFVEVFNSASKKLNNKDKANSVAQEVLKRNFRQVGKEWVKVNQYVDNVKLKFNNVVDNGNFTTYEGVTLTKVGVMNHFFKSNNTIESSTHNQILPIYKDHEDGDFWDMLFSTDSREMHGFVNNIHKESNNGEKSVVGDFNYFNGEIDGIDLNKHNQEKGMIELSIEYSAEETFDDKITVHENQSWSIGEDKKIHINAVADMFDQTPACDTEMGCGLKLNGQDREDGLTNKIEGDNKAEKEPELSEEGEESPPNIKSCGCKNKKNKEVINLDAKKITKTVKTNENESTEEIVEIAEEIMSVKEHDEKMQESVDKITELETKLAENDTKLEENSKLIDEMKPVVEKHNADKTEKTNKRREEILVIDSEFDKEKLNNMPDCEVKTLHEAMTKLNKKNGKVTEPVLPPHSSGANDEPENWEQVQTRMQNERHERYNTRTAEQNKQMNPGKFSNGGA